MFNLIFDKGLESERSLKLTSFYERQITNIFNGSYSVTVTPETVLPDVEDFAHNPMFKTVEAISSDGIKLPIGGEYNHISDLNSVYDDETKKYGINITLDCMVLTPPESQKEGNDAE